MICDDIALPPDQAALIARGSGRLASERGTRPTVPAQACASDHNNASDSIPPLFFDVYWPNVADFAALSALGTKITATSGPAIRGPGGGSGLSGDPRQHP